MSQFIGAWLVITVAITLAIWLDKVWMSLIAIFLVATRQNLLGSWFMSRSIDWAPVDPMVTC